MVYVEYTVMLDIVSPSCDGSLDSRNIPLPEAMVKEHSTHYTGG